MENLVIKETHSTPAINFNPIEGYFAIKGKSLPENVRKFYEPLIQYVTEYCETPNVITTIDVNLEYFNTSSSKIYLEIFKLFERIQLSNKSDVKIFWTYEEDDEDLKTAGDDYESLIKIPFIFKMLIN